MQIKIKHYFLTPSVNAPTRWDLVQQVTRTKKETEEKYESTADLGYGFSLESALQTIIAIELKKKNQTVTFTDYLNAYKAERDEVISLINNFQTIKI